MDRKIIIALDEIQNIEDVLALVRKIGNKVYAVKVHNLYDRIGPKLIGILKEAGAERVWVDAKLYDIPNTAELRAKDITGDIVTVHATGGIKMMQDALKSEKEIFAVTVLTSFKPEEVKRIYNRDVLEQVLILAMMAKEAGVKNLVCSAHEVKMLSTHPDLADMRFIVPGIRSVGVDVNDQNRVSTPAEAIKNGATKLVIGRQITQVPDPVAALDAIEAEIKEELELQNQSRH